MAKVITGDELSKHQDDCLLNLCCNDALVGYGDLYLIHLLNLGKGQSTPGRVTEWLELIFSILNVMQENVGKTPVNLEDFLHL